MQAQVTKWGNSLGIRIPRPFAEQVELEEGSLIDLSLEKDSIILCKKSYKLDDLVSKITPENSHKESDWGSPTGKEIW